jgi:hypothetical protein
MNEKKPTPLFVIDAPDVIEWPVTVHLPVDGGETAEFCFTGIFKRLSDAELDTLLGVEGPAKLKPMPHDGGGELVVGEIVEALPPAKRMAEVLRENADLFPQILVGWKQVKTTSGEDVPFSDHCLQAQVTGPNGRFVSAGLWRAIAEIRNGARLGN